jgi:formylglycine-generating enzyme
MPPSPLLSTVVLLLALPGGCFVEQYCFNDSDCAGGNICDQTTGACVWECTTDDECVGLGETCVDHSCTYTCSKDPLDCGKDMASVCGEFCMDEYEASRPDATVDDAGTDTSMATSRAGVLPWWNSTSADMNPEIAEAACQAAGKRLCSATEWQVACQGVDRSRYSYGDTYSPVACNGFDAFCAYNECRADEPYAGCGDECGADAHFEPTGALGDCRTSNGIFDLNGNVWEVVAPMADNPSVFYRGGAFNAADPELSTACDSSILSSDSLPSVRGFRCCSDGVAL